MGELTKIQWTHHTFNPWIGCTKVSPACDHCYAETGSARLAAQHGLKLWDGDQYFTGDEYWKGPRRWNQAALAAGERRRVFCASFADVFEDLDPGSTLYSRARSSARKLVRAKLFETIEATPRLDWLLLTKRPANMHTLTPRHWRAEWPANVWAGTTAEDQERATERVPLLVRVPARVRFVSYEPALGPVDWYEVSFGIDWIIVGGESGPHARPFHLQWARDTIEHCRRHDIAPFVKQLGALPVERKWPGELGKNGNPERGLTAHRRIVRVPLQSKKGDDMAEWPADLRVREFPRR